MDQSSLNENDASSELDTNYEPKSQATRGLFSEYCNNSTIHGVKYLGEHKRPILERIFWLCVFIASIYICGSLIMNVWNKWNENPVIVSFAEKSTPIWDIPFPSVTVCTEVRARREVFNFSDTLWKYPNISEKELSYLETLLQICTTEFSFGNENAYSPDLFKIMEELSANVNETYNTCYWRNKEGCKINQKVVTDVGICYSFNALNPRDIYRDEVLIDDAIVEDKHTEAVQWNLESGYNVRAGINAFPRRVLENGYRAGFILLLGANLYDNDHLCQMADHGFKVLLHTPGEVPQFTKQYVQIPNEQSVVISIKPEIITTSEGLRHYEPKRRHCYFQKERYLQYFRLYTQDNCKLECLSNFTMQRCGCVKFSMPRTLNTPVCGSAKILCMITAAENLVYEEFSSRQEETGDNYRSASSCNCLPGCTTISYNTEIAQSSIDLAAFARDLSGGRFVFNDTGYRLSAVTIFFKEAQFLASKRSELYGKTDFIANCGGLLGLFMGVSALSIVELVYFCTIRLLSNIKMQRKIRMEMECLQKSKKVLNEKGMELKEA